MSHSRPATFIADLLFTEILPDRVTRQYNRIISR
jgi:hypothetical protein